MTAALSRVARLTANGWQPGRLGPWVVVGLLLTILVGCAGRGRAPDVPMLPDTLENQAARAILAVWQQRLEEYIEREGNGDPAVLSHTRDLRSRHRQRPAAIGFSALELGSRSPGVDGRDVNGVLLGVERIAGDVWYVFLTAIVQRADYRPVGIQDMRLAAFSSGRQGLRWRLGHGNRAALEAYRVLPADTLSVRFPGDRDRYELTLSDGLVQAREWRSGAQWMLRLGGSPRAEP